MIAIRGGSGLGDSLYVQAIARHLIGHGHKVEACSDWPDIFRPLVVAGKCSVSPFRRQRIDRLAHYSTRRAETKTTQFRDCCISAGINEPVDLRLDWTVSDPALVARLREAGRPIVIVALSRAPMKRTDGLGAELLPARRVMQRTIDRLRGMVTVVQVGAGAALWQWGGIDIDLANKTTVAQLLDTAMVADGVLGWPSNLIPLAESFGKPAFFIWSRRGLDSRHLVVRQMTPEKLLHGRRSRFVIDDCDAPVIERSIDAFLKQVRSPAVV